MRARYSTFATFVMAGLMVAGPAIGQTTSAPAQAAGSSAPPSPAGHVAVDSDEIFMTGLRRIGVMAGEVVQCAPSEDRKAEVSDAMDLANQVALHFGLAAAFNFIGAVGYGSGQPFDKSGCAQATSGWDNITQKYLTQ